MWMLPNINNDLCTLCFYFICFFETDDGAQQSAHCSKLSVCYCFNYTTTDLLTRKEFKHSKHSALYCAHCDKVENTTKRRRQQSSICCVNIMLVNLVMVKLPSSKKKDSTKSSSYYLTAQDIHKSMVVFQPYEKLSYK